MNNLYFVSIELNEKKQWAVPSVLGQEGKEFDLASVKTALMYAKTVCLEATKRSQNKVRYYPVLMGQGRIIHGQKLNLSSATRSRANIPHAGVTRQVFNIREKLAPDKEHRIYVGEIVVDGEIYDVYTEVQTRSIVNRLPIEANTLVWKEGAFFRACDELKTYVSHPVRHDRDGVDYARYSSTDGISPSPINRSNENQSRPRNPTEQQIIDLITEAFDEVAGEQ